MKGFALWILVSLTLTVFVCFAFSSEGTASSSNPGFVPKQHRSDGTSTMKNRKLKDIGYTARNAETGNADLEDYRPIDPVPSSKASVRPGPIQHGTPLMPYIPKPSPPPESLKA